MLESEFRAKEQELVQSLEDLCALLRQYGVTHWAQHFEDAHDRLTLVRTRAAKVLECKALRRAYGGMGSFNDLIICPEHDYPIQKDQVRVVNDMVRRLGSRIWELSHIYEAGPNE